MKTWLIVALMACCLTAASAHAQQARLDSLVASIAATDNQQLSKLTFIELNILKNAIYSTRGFKYANDRQWLYDYFYATPKKAKLTVTGGWDLSSYQFPKPDESQAFATTPVMEKAIANVRVAIYRKIRVIGDVNLIDRLIDQEWTRHTMQGKTPALNVFGRKIIAATPFEESIKREVHGYRCILNIIDEKRDFDACELLGIYVGSVAMLKSVLEAQNGKIFDGTMGWEIMQLAGVTSRNERYDEAKLPDAVKIKLRRLDDIMKKMTSSGIGDVPQQFLRNQGSVELYYEEGC